MIAAPSCVFALLHVMLCNASSYIHTDVYVPCTALHVKTYRAAVKRVNLVLINTALMLVAAKVSNM